MIITNRDGFYNESMFEEMAQFAQHQIKLDHWRQEAKIYKGNTEIATVEDFRAVFNTPGEVQIKCRVTQALISEIQKKDDVKIVITSKGSLKQPSVTYKVTEWFEPLKGLVKDIENVKSVMLSENKWLYLRAEEK